MASGPQKSHPTFFPATLVLHSSASVLGRPEPPPPPRRRVEASFPRAGKYLRHRTPALLHRRGTEAVRDSRGSDSSKSLGKVEAELEPAGPWAFRTRS